MEKTLKVKGMHCRSCEMRLTDSVSEVAGVTKASADSKKGIVTVGIDDEAAVSAVIEKIKKEGYKVL